MNQTFTNTKLMPFVQGLRKWESKNKSDWRILQDYKKQCRVQKNFSKRLEKSIQLPVFLEIFQTH